MEHDNPQETSDLSFINKQQLSNYHIKDVFFLVLRNWYWILLCAIVGTLLAYLIAHGQTRIYESNAKILIRTGSGLSINDNDSREGSIRNALGIASFYASSINNEIMILTSKTTVQKAVEDLQLNVNYTSKPRFARRAKDLYGISPVVVEFADNNPQTEGSFSVQIIDSTTVKITQKGFTPITARFDQPVVTPLGSMLVRRTWNYTTNDNGREIVVTLRNLQEVADNYRHALVVIRDDEKNSIVNLSIHDISALRAADFINAVIRAYNDGAINDKKRIISDTYDYINQRISALSHDLGAQENALASYRSQNELIGPAELGQSYMNVSLQSSEEASRLQNELTMARYLLQTVTDNNGSQPISPGASINESGIMSTVARFNENALRIQDYNASGTTNNPVAINIISEQRRLQSHLATQINTYIASLEQRVGTARSTAFNAHAKMRQAPQKQIQLEGMERNQKIKEELYVTLLTRREELMISQPSIEGSAKIIDDARVNNTPVSPDETRITLLGLFFGLMAPLLYYLLFRAFDTRVKSYSDVERTASNIPFLCELPEVKDNLDKSIMDFDQEDNDISEAFRMLRTKVDFLVDQRENGAKTLLITSLIPASGKSFTSANLAVSISLSGKKVLLMDLDLRKGTLTKRFAHRSASGLVQYLTDKETDIEKLIQQNALAEGVDAIFSGPHPPNPAELLGTGKVDTLLELLRPRYDYIILDCPPAGLVVDTDIIKHLADHSIFIIRANKTDKRMLIDLERLHREKSFPNMALVLNAVRPDKQMYGYGYGYSYGYGSRYGYGYRYEDNGDEATKSRVAQAMSTATTHYKRLAKKITHRMTKKES